MGILRKKNSSTASSPEKNYALTFQTFPQENKIPPRDFTKRKFGKIWKFEKQQKFM